MYKQFCELCYDISWVRKRGGCSGLQILFSKLLKEDNITIQFSSWFIEHFLVAFRATLFVFSDFNEHVLYYIILLYI